MKSRFRLPAFFTAIATVLTLVGVGGQLPAAAAAAGCTDANGVSVVVDLRQLGGGILERCAAGLGAGATGLEALSRAGIPYQGTSQWGDAFICRLLGRPAADESLRIPGNNNYHEKCISTPPASAYWAYWYAPNGGSWQYSNSGASSHRVTPGGFEGWVFNLGDQSSPTPPGVAPVRTAAAPPPADGSPRTAQPNASKPDPADPSSNSAAHTNASSTGHRESGTAASSTSSPTTAAPSTSSHSSNGTGPADTGVSTSIRAVGGRTPSHSHGISTGAIVGACLLAFLLTVGGGTAWRQARSRRQS